MMWLMIVGCQLAQWVGVDNSVSFCIGLFQKRSIPPPPPTEDIGNTPLSPLRTSYTNLRHFLDNPYPPSPDGGSFFGTTHALLEIC